MFPQGYSGSCGRSRQLLKYVVDGLIFRLPGDSLVFGKWSAKNIMSQHKMMFVSMYMRTASYCIILEGFIFIAVRRRPWTGNGVCVS